MPDAGAAYLEVQQRMSATVRSLSRSQLDRWVPACPAWSVRQLVAHHTGVIIDFGQGDLGELGRLDRLINQHSDQPAATDRDSATARQVADREGRTITSVLDEWATATDQILPMLSGRIPFPEVVGPMGVAIVLCDIVVHEGDLHEALGLEMPRAVAATAIAMAGYGFGLDMRVREAGIPAMAIAYEGKQKVFGEGLPAATVTADRTTLVRMLGSRFTADEIAAFSWNGDPTPYLDLIGTYGPAHPGSAADLDS